MISCYDLRHPQRRLKMSVERSTLGNDLHVNMANGLTRAAHGLSLQEKRLLMLAVSKLDSTKPAIPDNMFVKLHVSEFANEYGITSKTVYGEVRAATEQLMNRYIRFFSKGGKKETRMQWVGRATYEESAGTVELVFWHELSPLLFALGKEFTSYKLSRVGALRSFYSWRLFELLMQFRTTGYLKIKLSNFWEIMEVPQSMRSKFTNLTSRVIEPAIREIQDKDGLKVKWEPIKTGRKVTALEFYFPVEQQAALPLDKPKPKARQRTPEQETRAEQAREDAATIEGAKRLAELSGEPVETFLPKHLQEAYQKQKKPMA